MNDNRFYTWLAAIAVLFLALRIAFYSQLTGSSILALPVLDSDWYYRWAASLARGYGHPHGPFWLGPGYPVAIAALFKALGTIDIKVIPVAQLLLSTGTLMLLALIVRKHLGDLAALLTAAIAILYAPWMYYDGMLLSASWIFFLNTLLLFLLLNHSNLIAGNDIPKQKSFLVWSAAGLVCGLSAISRPTVLVFIVILIAAILIRRQLAARYLKLVLFVGMIVLVHLPVLIRNLDTGGSAAFVTSSGGINFYIGNRHNATGKYDEAPWVASFDAVREAEGYRLEASKRVSEELTLQEANRFWGQQALREIFRFKLDWVQLLGKKLWLTFRNEEFPNNFSFKGAQSLIPLLNKLPLGFGLLLPFAAAGFVLLWPNRKKLWILWCYAAGYIAVNLIFFTSSEYRFPLLLVLLPLAAYFLVAIWKLLEAKQWSRIAAAICVYMVVLLAANWPSPELAAKTRPLADFRNLGSVAALRKQYTEAVGYYSRALTIDAGDSSARIGLADAMWNLGSFDEARDEYARAGVEPPDHISGSTVRKLLRTTDSLVVAGDTTAALELLSERFPNQESSPPEILAAVARIQFDSGKPVEAAKLMMRAHRRDPQAPEWPYYAGDFLLETGDVAAADSLYRQALQIYPAFAPARIARAFLAVEVGNLRVARSELSELQRISIAEDSVQVQVDSLASLLDSLNK